MDYVANTPQNDMFEGSLIIHNHIQIHIITFAVLGMQFQGYTYKFVLCCNVNLT